MENSPQTPEPLVLPGPDCPSEERLIDLAKGRLGGAGAAALRAHAERCSACTLMLVGLSDTASDPEHGTDPEAATERKKPSLFVAEFRLIRPLGKGAMGEVFLALDTFLDRLVALKFLATSETRSSARERFYVEARAVARLQHPNVVTLYRAGEDQGRRYLVSEYVRGQSLERQKKPLPWRKVLDIGLRLASGLAEAHQHGVLHRDIKPAHVTTE